MAKIEKALSTFSEDLKYDWGELETMFPSPDCYLVALDDWEISILLSSMRYAHWSKRWANMGETLWDDIEAKITTLEHCLMAGCNVSELIDRFDTLNANLVANNEDVVEAINNLSEQFIYRAGEEVQDITIFVRNLANTLSDLKYDLRYLLLTYGDKSISQIISELPIAGISTAIDNQELTSVCSPDVNVNCGGGGCSGGGALGSPITGSLTDSDPAEEPGDPAIDPPPTGFDSWAEYDLHKCMAANFIAQGTEQLFRLLGTANSYVSAGAIAGAGAAITELLFGAASIAMSAGVLGGAAGVSLLAGGVILTLPGWVVGAIVAAILLVIVAEVSILLLFINAADEYHANIEQTVCDLYNAQTVEEAKTVLSTAWGDAIASFAIEPPYNAWEAAIRSMMSTVIGYVITNTLVNMLFEPSDLVDKYTDAPVDCDTCLDQGVFDFTIDEQGWEIDEAGSTNGAYDAVNGYFWGSVSGSGTATLTIYYPVEKVTINTLRMWVYGTLQELDIITIKSADDYLGTWTTEATQTDVPTPGAEPGGFTIVEFTGLNITDKYIEIYLNRFWTNAAVLIQRVEWE